MITIPEYPWFDQVPDNLKTRNQLAELGLRPGGQVKARVVWKRGKRWADLFDLAEAKPKREPTAAQLAALAKAHEKRRTCPVCKTVFDYVLTWRDVESCPVCNEADRAAELAKVRQIAQRWMVDSLILDTETTDLDGFIVQIAVIDTAGRVLLDTLVNPLAPISAGAQQIHGITADQVATAPAFANILPALRQLLTGRRVVIYNASFDTSILLNEMWRLETGPKPGTDRPGRLPFFSDYFQAEWVCAMELYAVFVGDWSDYHGDYRWQPLPGGDHTALGDCRATLEVLKLMAGGE